LKENRDVRNRETKTEWNGEDRFSNYNVKKRKSVNRQNCQWTADAALKPNGKSELVQKLKHQSTFISVVG